MCTRLKMWYNIRVKGRGLKNRNLKKFKKPIDNLKKKLYN